MTTPTFTDSPEQAAVIGAPSHSDVLVVAGAGSGKTYTMTRRIIDLIGRGVAPERILGLTFTRKAAGELLSRVSSAVIGAGAADGADMDRMFLKPTISTYDAFFQSIVRQYGLLVGFDQNTQPLSEAGALQLVTNVIDRHMDLLRGKDLGAFSTLASRVLTLSGAIGSSMIGGDVTDMDEAVAKVRAWDAAFTQRVRETLAGETIPETEPNIKAPKRLKKDSDETWAAKIEEHHRRLHDMCVYRCAGLLDVAERRETLLDLVQAYAAEKRRLNKAEFSDFTIAAYRLVTRFPSIGERCRSRFSHVLLDEYQDTSTTQAELLATLFHGEGTAVNAVGDPFQSIYAWRGASPGAFRMFQHDFHMPAGSRPYALSVTRRNPRIVLDAANDLTQPLRTTPRRPGSSLMREVDVTPLSTMPEAPEGTIGVLGYATLGQEIDAVARFCRAAARPDPAAAAGATGKADKADKADKDDKDGKEPPRKTAAVLFRSKKNMAIYQQALEEAGLRVAVVGYSAMLERPEIRDMTALLRVAADHTDSQALMRLLATPRFGLGAKDLDALAAIASDLNVDAQYRALVAAGVVADGAERSERAGLVREHRDDVANAVFLTDVLLRDDLDELVERSHDEGRLSEAAARVLPRAGRMLRRVCDVVGRPLQDVVRASCEALDLDIDTVVAQALRPGGKLNPTLARVPMDAVLGLTDTYVSEIAADATPTLRGFTAWLAALKSIEDETSSFETDREADVELMTVHQSKGLEWDAVAVVGLTAGGFPSSQGDSLSVKPDEEHTGGREGGRWVAPEYRESARTWLDDPTAVPVPVRADAGILPRFPHDMGAGADPLEALARLDDVELIDDEVYGSLREVGDGVEDMDPSGWHLTQSEEYGRRLHADERRLMYVALTRAKRDALLTYSLSGDMDRAPEGEPKGKAKPSNFWLEVHDSLHSHPGAVDAAAMADGVDGEASSLAEAGTAPPIGFFAGEHADEYARAVVGEAWSQPYECRDEGATLPWPASLSDASRARLDGSAALVREAMRTGMERADGPAAHDGPSPLPGGRSLLERARLLVADEDLMTSVPDETSLDLGVKAKAQRILAGSRQSVTGLQARAGGMNAREERRYWRGIVRPIPSIAAPTASAGTRFHAWAERFIDAAIPRAEAFGVTREELLADLERRETGTAGGVAAPGTETVSSVSAVSAASAESDAHADATASDALATPSDAPSPGMDGTLALWARRLASSRWAERTPAWAERQIVVALPQLDGVIANGKLDAVFHGGLDPADATKRYTVIDWKTGRRPRDAKHVAEKLVQLDLYRLLLSAMEQVPLDSIDAALYYVSEPDERHRELRAGNKTEEQIIAELSSGIPAHTDDD